MVCQYAKVDAVVYDPSGYGHSTGQPSVKQSLLDIASVMSFMQRAYNIPPSKVIILLELGNRTCGEWVAHWFGDKGGWNFCKSLSVN
jgi:hypothetical protein